MIGLSSGDSVYDQETCRSFATGDFVLADSFRGSGIFRPGNPFSSSCINGNRLAFQSRGQGGNQHLFHHVIGRCLAVVPGRRRNPVHPVILLLHGIRISRNAGIGSVRVFVKLPRLFGHIAKGVVFLQCRGHGRGRRSRIPLRLDKMLPFIIREPAVIETAQSVGCGRADDFPITVGDFPERCYRVSFWLRFQCDFPDSVLHRVNPVSQFLLSRPSLVEKSTVRGSRPNQGCSMGKRRRCR